MSFTRDRKTGNDYCQNCGYRVPKGQSRKEHKVKCARVMTYGLYPTSHPQR